MWCWVPVNPSVIPLSVPGDYRLRLWSVKSNVSCLLGELYEPTDPRREAVSR